MFFFSDAEFADRSKAETRRDRLIVAGIILAVGLIFCAMRLREIATLDFPCFYVAGRLAGGARLYDFQFFTAYERGLGLNPEIFPYPAAFAALFAPLAALSLQHAYVLYSCVVSACGAAAARLLVRRLRMKARIAACVIIGWMPTATNFAAAQNSIIAFLFALLLLDAVENRREVAAGAWAGLALFKPTFGVFFVLWLIFERRRKAAAVAVCGAIGWYFASIPAAGGDWAWPAGWLRLLVQYQPLDFAATQWLHIGLFSVLTRMHVPTAIIVCLFIALWAAALRAARSLTISDRFYFLLAVIPALSPHALLYDGVFTLPALLRLLQLQTPFTRAWFYAAYGLGAASLAFAHPVVNSALAPVVLTPLVFVFALGEERRKAESLERAR